MAKALGVLSSMMANSHFEEGGRTPALSSRRAAATILRPISLVVAAGGRDYLETDFPDLGQALVAGQLLHLRKFRGGHRDHFRFVDEDELGTARDRDVLAADEGQSGQEQQG